MKIRGVSHRLSKIIDLAKVFFELHESDSVVLLAVIRAFRGLDFFHKAFSDLDCLPTTKKGKLVRQSQIKCTYNLQLPFVKPILNFIALFYVEFLSFQIQSKRRSSRCDNSTFHANVCNLILFVLLANVATTE